MLSSAKMTRDEWRFLGYLRREARNARKYGKLRRLESKRQLYEGRAQMAAEAVEEFENYIRGRYVATGSKKHRAGHQQLSNDAGA